MIPLGAQVRWRPDVYKAPPIGTVTARNGRMLDIDGRGWWVSEGLLEVVGEMTDDTMTTDQLLGGLRVEAAALRAERDALQAVVVQQCEALADTVPTHKFEALQDAVSTLADEVERLKEYEQYAESVKYYLEGYMLATFGERNPARPIDPPELRALVTFVYEG